MAHELFTIRQWVYTTLAADSALVALIGGAPNPRIFQGKGAQGSLYPQVQIRYVSGVGGGDFNTLNNERIWTRARFLIVGIVEARSYTKAYPIAKAIDTLLHRQHGSAIDGVVHHCKREMPYDQSYEENGISYTESGAFWEIACRSN